jgi:hypothetical protein
MLPFQLEMGGDGMKHYQKMKWRQRAHFDSMEKSVTRRGDIGRRRGGTGGGEREETTPVGLKRILLGQKLKKIYVVDSADTNER